MIEGTWIYDRQNRILEIFDASGASIFKYILIELNNQILKIKNYFAQQGVEVMPLLQCSQLKRNILQEKRHQCRDRLTCPQQLNNGRIL